MHFTYYFGIIYKKNEERILTNKRACILTCVTLGIAFLLQLLYACAIFTKNNALYLVSVSGMVPIVALMFFVLLSLKTAKKAIRFSVLISLLYASTFIGINALLHFLVFKQTLITATVLCFTGSNFVLFTVLSTCILKSTQGKRALLGTISAILIFSIALTGVVSSFPEYVSTIYQAYVRPSFVCPDNASDRRAIDMDKNVRLLVNIDETTQVSELNLHLQDKTHVTEEDLIFYIEPYFNTQVTDIMFNISGQSSASPTNVFTYRGDKFTQTEENGVAVDYSNITYWWKSLQEQNVNPFPIWFEQCKEHGINPWISLRMNDCHEPDAITSFLRGDFFYEARGNGWMIGEEYGYNHTCLNYAVEEVRKRMLDYIEEQLSMYDVYGLELDWLREIYCFDYLHEENATIVAIMNDFMRNVKSIVKKAEALHGHSIKLTARLSRDIDQNKTFGFDVRTWYNERLIDSITISPRFSSCDSGMDIRVWKATFPEIDVYAGIESRVSPTGEPKENAVADVDTVRGYAAQYMTDGADGIYLFNLMVYGCMGHTEPIYNTCGNFGTAINNSRRHVMTYQDLAPANAERYSPLPIVAVKGKTVGITQKIASAPDNAIVNIYIGTTAKIKEKRLKLSIDGASCTFEGAATVYAKNSQSNGEPIENGYVPNDSYVYKFTVTDTAKIGDVAYISVTNRSLIPVFITYFELEIIVE